MLGPITPKAHSITDPFDEVLKPPPDETDSERQFREARQEEAKRVSNAIDDAIKAERQMRKKKRIIRLLLLGQSESGESLLVSFMVRVFTPEICRQVDDA
jgi:guanine nucleotide-binding protein alpha-1 subunit